MKRFAAAVAAAPAPNAGAGVTPAALRRRWSELEGVQDVIGFYGHGTRAGEHRCFSNFFDQSNEPFEFVVPEALCACAIDEEDRNVSCEFSEKAIMLCKAAAMGDRRSYDSIRKCTSPSRAKSLGRSVAPFDNNVWDRVVCSVAFEIVYQKFSKTPSIRGVLLGTGDRLIAEATRNDRNWGIGIDVGDARVLQPSMWQGYNILGWALMEARAAINRDEALQSKAAKREEPSH
eukprot:TRINITY_DN48098_c0_g1_i1.p1 TRINITY_DN48098_c0_g1~~TRINITY_DN48098_c0_g1_i1.p1  ORF type:complete len:247 (-),score=62.92 TRINITY_DN48098_c0_g1_i1:90-785(-)